MRYFLFLLVFGAASLFASEELFVETLDEQYSSSNLLSFRFRIHNEWDYLKDAVLKYCLLKEPGKEVVVERYYPRDSRVNIREIDSVHVCIEYVLDSVPEGLFPNESGYSMGIRYKDWANRNKYDDFSMPKSSAFSVADNVAIYADGMRVWGNVPEWAENVELLPDAQPYALPDGVKVILEDGRPMRFVWNHVPGADLYRLMVYSSADTSLVYENVYASNAADVYLPSGDYLWVVHSLTSGIESGQNPAPYIDPPEVISGDAIGLSLVRLLILNREINYAMSYSEYVRIGAPFDTIAASNGRKDTRLLNIAWGELADMYGWDEIHSPPDPVTRPLDADEGNRCWAIAIQELNHYYTTKDGVHGNLTLDEMVSGRPLLSPRRTSISRRAVLNRLSRCTGPSWIPKGIRKNAISRCCRWATSTANSAISTAPFPVTAKWCSSIPIPTGPPRPNVLSKMPCGSKSMHRNSRAVRDSSCA